jgi:hypothetical protein
MLAQLQGTTEIDQEDTLTAMQNSMATMTPQRGQGTSPFASWGGNMDAGDSDEVEQTDTVTKLDEELARAWGWK